MPERDLLTRHEAAEYFGIHVATLDRWIRKRYLESVMLGGSRRIPMSSIENMISRATPRTRRKRATG